VNLHGVALRHAWGEGYSDLIGPQRRCIWFEERGLFEILTTRTGIPVPLRLIAGEALKARWPSGAHFSVTDPVPFASMSWSWVRNGMRRLRG